MWGWLDVSEYEGDQDVSGPVGGPCEAYLTWLHDLSTSEQITHRCWNVPRWPGATGIWQ